MKPTEASWFALAHGRAKGMPGTIAKKSRLWLGRPCPCRSAFRCIALHTHRTCNEFARRATNATNAEKLCNPKAGKRIIHCMRDSHRHAMNCNECVAIPDRPCKKIFFATISYAAGSYIVSRGRG